MLNLTGIEASSTVLVERHRIKVHVKPAKNCSDSILQQHQRKVSKAGAAGSTQVRTTSPSQQAWSCVFRDHQRGLFQAILSEKEEKAF